jgi:dUTP pyrophosphatase
MRIKVKKAREDAILPSYAHDGDAGMDIFSCEEVLIKAGETKLISTGLAFEIPYGFEMQIRPKSGLALNNGLTVLNSPGTLDAGYRGELKILLFNTGKNDYNVKKAQKICQGIVSKIEIVEIQEEKSLSQSERGEKGFGSTGL